MFENYKAEPIKPNVVKEEGVYTVKITNVSQSTMQKDGKEVQYIKADCMINADGFPMIALFITEGRNFNAVATAFFDTFGIPRGDFNFNDWMNRKGQIRIGLKRKGEFINMVPTYLLDENGYVVRPQNDACKMPNKDNFVEHVQQEKPAQTGNGAQYQTPPDDEIPFDTF